MVNYKRNSERSRILLLIATRESYVQLCSLCRNLQSGAKWRGFACIVAQSIQTYGDWVIMQECWGLGLNSHALA